MVLVVRPVDPLTDPPGSGETTDHDEWTQDRSLSRRWALRIIVAAALGSVVQRILQLTAQFEGDEVEFRYVARWWSHGARLYTDVFTDRPQLLLLIYRGLNRVNGSDRWSPSSISARSGV